MKEEIIVKGKFIKFRWGKPTQKFRDKSKYYRKIKYKTNPKED